MKPEAQQIAIAEACGWKPRCECLTEPTNSSEVWDGCPLHGDPRFTHYPNYPSDLNAMHEAVETLSEQQYIRYLVELARIVERDKTERDPTTAQRAEAFLRTLNLWKD